MTETASASLSKFYRRFAISVFINSYELFQSRSHCGKTDIRQTSINRIEDACSVFGGQVMHDSAKQFKPSSAAQS